MYLVGQLKDEKMALEIVEVLQREGLVAKLTWQSDMYLITLGSEEKLNQAQEIFRLKVGLKAAPRLDPEWIRVKALPRGIWTTRIIIFSVIIYLFSYLSIGGGLYQVLEIDFAKPYEFWRFITPIFLHMGFLHILFNMLWLNDLGRILENYLGAKKFILILMMLGFFSNVLQAYMIGPNFGGMSGVLYGFLGLIWVMGKLDASFISLPKHDIISMIAWFFLCLFGIFPHVANFAHAGGLFLGMILALFISKTGTWKRKFLYAFVAVFFLGITFLVTTLTSEKAEAEEVVVDINRVRAEEYPIDFHYRAGSYLVYDCRFLHYACVDLDSFNLCKENRNKNLEAHEKYLSCAPFLKFSNKEECLIKNYELLEQNPARRFCYPSIDGKLK